MVIRLGVARIVALIPLRGTDLSHLERVQNVCRVQPGLFSLSPTAEVKPGVYISTSPYMIYVK